MDNKKYTDKLLIGEIEFTDSVNEVSVGRPNLDKFGTCKIYVYGNEGPVPHFHLEKSNGEVICCICIFGNSNSGIIIEFCRYLFYKIYYYLGISWRIYIFKNNPVTCHYRPSVAGTFHFFCIFVVWLYVCFNLSRIFPRYIRYLFCKCAV